jgi:hypothetical protein
MLRVRRVRFSIRAIMVVAGVAGTTIGLVIRGMAQPDFPAIPGMILDVGPDNTDPFPGRSFDEVVRSLEESPHCHCVFPPLLNTLNDGQAAVFVDPARPEGSERMKHELRDPCNR